MPAAACCSQDLHGPFETFDLGDFDLEDGCGAPAWPMPPTAGSPPPGTTRSWSPPGFSAHRRLRTDHAAQLPVRRYAKQADVHEGLRRNAHKRGDHSTKKGSPVG